MISCPIGASGSWLNLPPPELAPLLIVKGALSLTNVGNEAHLDRALLETFGVTTVRTSTPWSEATHEFEGVLLGSLLKALGASGTSMRSRALNDYEVDIPIEDVQRYKVLIAWSCDGISLTRRDKGPLWLVYPWSDHPELNNSATKQRSIWQLHEIELQN